MTLTTITVGYERKMSDGNYGSEGVSLSWTVTYEDDSELAAEQSIVSARTAHISTALRTAVLTELSKSEARNVAYAAQRELNPPASKPQPIAAGGPAESLEDMPF